METKEIMQNTEVMDVAEEIVTTGPSKGVKIAAGVGLAALIGGLAYKFVVKPLVAKAKAKKEQEAMIDDIDDEEYDVEETDED